MELKRICNLRMEIMELVAWWEGAGGTGSCWKEGTGGRELESWRKQSQETKKGWRELQRSGWRKGVIER